MHAYIHYEVLGLTAVLACCDLLAGDVLQLRAKTFLTATTFLGFFSAKKAM
jgi:hypothetical protein